jgi:hypothetical protein
MDSSTLPQHTRKHTTNVVLKQTPTLQAMSCVLRHALLLLLQVLLS